MPLPQHLFAVACGGKRGGSDSNVPAAPGRRLSNADYAATGIVNCRNGLPQFYQAAAAQ